MTFPSSGAPDSRANSTSSAVGARSSRSSQFAWGPPPQQPSRRGLTPISTAFGASNSNPSRAADPFGSSSQQPLSPIAAANPPSTTTRPRQITSRASSLSSSSPWSPSLSGTQQLSSSQLLSSAKSKTIASANNPSLASSAVPLPTASQSGGAGAPGGGGGASRDTRSSPSLSLSHSNIASPSTTSNPTTAQASSQGGLTRIVIAQIFLLLSTIKDGSGSQAEQIRKLVDGHGMEVFTKYFRRLVQSSSATIFAGTVTRDAQNPASYPILSGEVQKILQELDQVDKIAASLDASDPELFKDFDLSGFMDHFKLDPMAKTALAFACKNASKPDLRVKADAIISSNFQAFLVTLTNPYQSDPDSVDDVSPGLIASLIDRFQLSPPRNWNEENKGALFLAIRLRYQKLGTFPPPEVCRSLMVMDLLTSHNPLVHLVQRTGPRATSSLDACKALLESAEMRDINYQQVASVLLYMGTVDQGQSYNIAVFISAIREHRAGQRLDWQDVVHSFDRELVRVTKAQFLTLYDVLLPLAREYENFDIQLLWGGKWSNGEAQFSFVMAFLRCTPNEIDVTQIPKLRKAYDLDLFEDASDEIKACAAKAVTSPMVSYDASSTLFSMMFHTQESYNHANELGVPNSIINPNTDNFLIAAVAVPKPWAQLQELALHKLFKDFLAKTLPQYKFVLYGLWKQNRIWVAQELIQSYIENPMNLLVIKEHVDEQGWLEPLLSLSNDLSLDLAMHAHGLGEFDPESWVRQNFEQPNKIFQGVLYRYLMTRADNENQVQREQSAPTVVPLRLRTVHAMILLLQEHLSDEETVTLHRTCIASYPRLVNYGEGFDDILNENSKGGNAIPQDIDKKMQEHYKRMYNEENTVREIIEKLRDYKLSRDPADQDLFACMIHGLFDEYNCFGEYPQEALARTGVLFGGLIQYKLLSRIALQAALGMVLDAVAVYPPEDLMHKFGMQALMDFAGRLPELPHFCHRLLQVASLQNTEIYSKAEEVVSGRKMGVVEAGGETNGTVHDADVTNGRVDDFLATEPIGPPPFGCVTADPSFHENFYEEPDEEVQDKVLFVLNNVSVRNLTEKLRDLRDALEERHHQWFAHYLVEQRAKTQPNFQPLYVDMLEQFNDKDLWTEVLRETYLSVVRMVNSQKTMDETTERRNLQNLGIWLGSLTVARDKPILLRNISFRQFLIEGYDTERLIIVIPFTCKVLAQAVKSVIFQPSNPWIGEIFGMLAELYHHASLKINLKFEIEVLCKAFGEDVSKIEPTEMIMSRQTIEDGALVSQLPDSLADEFSQMSFPTIDGARGLAERFNWDDMTAVISDMPSRLRFPPTSSHGEDSSINLHALYIDAVKRALLEIIPAVVERSVTIASISTSQLVTKDFALEGNDDKFRDASDSVAKSLSGSLALVTCKEPLRSAIMNNIRLLGRQILGPEGLPEGLILMFVNDNIDVICQMVEQAAETQAHDEIARQIEDGSQARLRHRAQHPGQPFADQDRLNRWSMLIPDPYKVQLGQVGLNQEQLDIYKDFGRQARGMPTHAINASTDSGRQVPDVLQDQFPTIPNLATPSEAPAVARQTQSQRLHSVPPVQQVHGQPQLNGFMEPQSIMDRTKELLSELQHAVREATEQHVNELPAQAPTQQVYDELLKLLTSDVLPQVQQDNLAVSLASDLTNHLYNPELKRLEIEVFANLLGHLCNISISTARHVVMFLGLAEEDRLFNAAVAVNLIKVHLLDVHQVDAIVARHMLNRRDIAFAFLGELLDELLLREQTPLAFRADFARCFEALTVILKEDPDREDANYIVSRLLSTANEAPETPQSANTTDQIEYIFEEWIHLQPSGQQMQDVTEKSVTAFILQIGSRRMLATNEDAALFFRVCIDMALAGYEEQVNIMGDLDTAYLRVDALASLITKLVQHHAQVDGAVRFTKAQYFDAILSLVVMVIYDYYHRTGDRFNQKVFFRFFSSLLFELTGTRQSHVLAPIRNDCILVVARALIALQPRFMPGFAFAWQSLISHRVFMPALLKMPGHAGWDSCLKLFEGLLSYAGELVKPMEPSALARDFYRGVLRISLVMHHDFPEFLTENHFSLCNAIPAHCTQLRNLVVSAFPHSFPELPDPFTSGLKVDRFEEARKVPIIRGDLEGVLDDAHVKDLIDDILGGSVPDLSDIQVSRILQAINSPARIETGLGHVPINVDTTLLHAIVLYVGSSAVGTSSAKGSSSFISHSPHARLLERLARELSPQGRHFFISAIVNQLRYPNAYTQYFCYALLHLFKSADLTDSIIPEDVNTVLEVQQQITRVLLERLNVNRPHPWGLIITLLEILKNPDYKFWQLDSIRAVPDVERAMNALFLHNNGNPLAIA
ncbi:MAG: hypothetical protein M1820_003096 [Bogoriella megaspora]|nr:MAG: hypothetical protein M1820_003096 [Bogoriella megaspora]